MFKNIFIFCLSIGLLSADRGPGIKLNPKNSISLLEDMLDITIVMSFYKKEILHVFT